MEPGRRDSVYAALAPAADARGGRRRSGDACDGAGRRTRGDRARLAGVPARRPAVHVSRAHAGCGKERAVSRIARFDRAHAPGRRAVDAGVRAGLSAVPPGRHPVCASLRRSVGTLHG